MKLSSNDQLSLPKFPNMYSTIPPLPVGNMLSKLDTTSFIHCCYRLDTIRKPM